MSVTLQNLAVPTQAVVVPNSDRKIAILQNEKLPFDATYLTWKLGWKLQESELAITEYKKFLVLAYESKVEVTPSFVVDEVWHHHILHTKAYAEFCGRMGKFLHHNPGGPAQPKEEARFAYQYEITLSAYREMFGVEAPETVWPRTKKAEKQSIARLLQEMMTKLT